MCVYQEQNEDAKVSPVRALGRPCVSIRQNMSNINTYLLVYWVEGKHKYVIAENTSAELKFAATALNCPSLNGIPVERVDTNSLRSGGDNALLLAGYSGRYI